MANGRGFSSSTTTTISAGTRRDVYNTLYDPEEWAFTSSPSRPAVRGRRPLGRVAIANSDAAASPHTDAAIDEAYRAVMELSSLDS